MSPLFHPNQTNVTDEILLEVFLQIKSESCNELIQHLINNKIGFRLSSLNSIPAKSKPYISETPELSTINVDDKLHKDIIIQEVYDKYITNGLASLSPCSRRNRNGIEYQRTHFQNALQGFVWKIFLSGLHGQKNGIRRPITPTRLPSQ
jgi:hypothetical protein